MDRASIFTLTLSAFRELRMDLAMARLNSPKSEGHGLAEFMTLPGCKMRTVQFVSIVPLLLCVLTTAGRLGRSTVGRARSAIANDFAHYNDLSLLSITWMSEYSKHHFVPQFSLRQFANDANERQIGTYLLDRGQYIPSTSIRNQAQRAKLYGSIERENVLSQVEGAASAVVRNMVNKLEVPARNSPDHTTLLVHVLFQLTRTPRAAAEVEEGINHLVKNLMSDDPSVAPHVDQVRIKLNQGTLQALSVAAKSIELTIDLHYKLLQNRTNIPFIISDHPVAKYNQFMERRKVDLGGTGFASRGLQLLLPISPQLTLIMYDGDVYRVGRYPEHDVVDLIEGDVDALNMLQVINAGSQFFFNKRMTMDLAKELVRRSEPWMHKARLTTKEFPQPPKEPDTRRSIVITSQNDIRIGLTLSKIVELPSAQKYKITDGASFMRDPNLWRLHSDFEDRVSAGLYDRSQLPRYLDDVVLKRVRQFYEGQ
jgi:hypothetical protein